MEARSSRLIEALFDDPRLAPRRTSRKWLVPRLMRIAWRTLVPFRFLFALLFPAAARRGAQQAGESAVGPSWDLPSDPALAVDEVERLLASAVPSCFLRSGPCFLAGMAALQAARRLLGDAASRADFDEVLRGIPYNVTTEMNLALAGLARHAAADPASRALVDVPARELAARYARGELPAVLQTGLSAFLEEWGARGVAEIDPGLPRWREDPTQLLASVQAFMRAGPAGDPEVQFRRGAEEAEAMVQELVRRARQHGWLRARAVAFLLSRARRLAGLRESPKFYLVRIFDRSRLLLERVGDTLHRAGRLASPDGVFFLTLREARVALGGASVEAIESERRATRAQELQRKHLPRVLLSDGSEVVPAGEAEQEGVLQGTAASAGTVSGTARVVFDPSDAKLQPGDILVAPSTDPGWTPLFLSASALVMEMGGAMSHGAVVAREYGIPAVVGVSRATERIAGGAKIEVDGTHGVVRIDGIAGK
jgi:pyruvate,water dikinase